jgi:hypothetical protein
MTWITKKLVFAAFSVLAPMGGTSIHIIHIFRLGDPFLAKEYSFICPE